MKPPIKFLNLSYYPLGDTTQYFGENPKLYSQFNMEGHNGIDLVRPWGEPLYAIEAGEVVAVKNDPHGYGMNVRIVSNNKINDSYYNEWVFGHTSQNLVKVGDKVFAGQLIALMGNTGFTISGSTPYWKNNPYAGTHVHVGLRQVTKPKSGGFFYEGSKLRVHVLNHRNGYKGSVDPLSELRKTEAPEVNRKMYRQLLTIKSMINSLKKSLSFKK